MPSWIGTAILLVTLGIATVTDIRSRKVPRSVTVGSILVGLVAAVIAGPEALLHSVLGLLVGGLLLLPFVLLGGLGLADALLLGAVGTWQGWEFVLHAAVWMALVGGVLAVIARIRAQPKLAYVPAIAIGTIVAFVIRQ